MSDKKTQYTPGPWRWGTWISATYGKGPRETRRAYYFIAEANEEDVYTSMYKFLEANSIGHTSCRLDSITCLAPVPYGHRCTEREFRENPDRFVVIKAEESGDEDEADCWITCSRDNGRLIAQAPELLEACKVAVCHITGGSKQTAHYPLIPPASKGEQLGSQESRVLAMLEAVILAADGAPDPNEVVYDWNWAKEQQAEGKDA